MPWPQLSRAWALVQSNAAATVEAENRHNSLRMSRLLRWYGRSWRRHLVARHSPEVQNRREAPAEMERSQSAMMVRSTAGGRRPNLLSLLNQQSTRNGVGAAAAVLAHLEREELI